MKSKKGSRIECYDTTVIVEKLYFIITKSDLMGLSKLSWQRKKSKLQKMLGNGQITISRNPSHSGKLFWYFFGEIGTKKLGLRNWHFCRT